MRLVRTVRPTSYPVSLVEVKSHCNVLHSDWDANFDRMISALTNRLDGWEGILGRCIMPQTWTMYMDKFGAPFAGQGRYGSDFHGYEHQSHFYWLADEPIEIPLPPLISIDSVEYTDDLDAVQIVDPADYQVTTGGKFSSYIIPVPNESWPTPKFQAQSVRITFTAGYQIGSPDLETIKHAMLMTLSNWNENREESEIPEGARTLLAPYRRMPV